MVKTTGNKTDPRDSRDPPRNVSEILVPAVVASIWGRWVAGMESRRA